MMHIDKHKLHSQDLLQVDTNAIPVTPTAVVPPVIAVFPTVKVATEAAALPTERIAIKAVCNVSIFT